ncbi:MAG: 3-hydroxyacyl-CoA dehydrogenase [Chitinophagaceae bacterium]|nr:MAG: 3-hydroxyacyl-CoA dehydrogenase [Chitinophagaceae bacterium]
MNILIIGEKVSASELRKKIPEEFNVDHRILVNDSILGKYDLIFDLQFDEKEDNLQYYAPMQDKVIFVGAVRKQLAQIQKDFHGEIQCKLIGMNTLPTFMDRPVLEFSLLEKEDEDILKKLAAKLNWNYCLVEDRVGMVTPRVLFMIINEACFTLQEGTASIADIDKGMKLGTGYPMGPLEWSDKIGIEQVYTTLSRLYEDTADERYKICPLLKSYYLKNKSFY